MRSNSFTVIPIKASKRFGKFELCEVVAEAIRAEGEALKEKDIVVVSSKFAAMAEGRFTDLKKVRPSKHALALSVKYSIEPALAELILQESESILGGINGFVLAVSQGILAPNAGIDRSNVPPNFAILYPRNPKKTVKKLRTHLLKTSRKTLSEIGVVLSDSRITPTRFGTIGISIASLGFSPVEDFRGHKDLFGNKLKVTVKAVADEISSAAQLVMGEADESVPIVIVRGYNYRDDRNSLSTFISHKQCLYIQGLAQGE